MPWLLDGNNVAGGPHRERVRQAALTLAHREKLRIVVFFDGAPPPGVSAVEKLGSVEVRYVPQADAAILAFLQSSPQGFQLVTSDRDLAQKARRLGVRVLPVEAFWQKLSSSGSSREEREKALPQTPQELFSQITPLPETAGRIRRKKQRRW